MKRFRITYCYEMQLYTACFANIIDAYHFACDAGQYFVSFRDSEQGISIFDIDALTAYYENLMI